MIYHRSQAAAITCPPLTNPVQGQIVIVPDEALTPWEPCPEFKSVNLNPDKKFTGEIVISPCRYENFSSGILMKLKLACERRNIKITTFGSKNFFPFYSIFSDEIVVAEQLVKPAWYGDSISTNQIYANPIFDMENFVELDAKQMKMFGHFGDMHPEWADKPLHPIVVEAEAMTAEEVGERFGPWIVHVLNSSYSVFRELEPMLPKDIIVGELKLGTSFLTELIKQKHFPMVGIDPVQGFQKGLLEKTGIDNYLTTQILGSWTLNWRYICGGGSSNLFCVVPMKLLFAGDFVLNDTIIRELSKVRYGNLGNIYPVMSKAEAWSGKMDGIVHKSLPGMAKAAQILSDTPKPQVYTFLSKLS